MSFHFNEFTFMKTPIRFLCLLSLLACCLSAHAVPRVSVGVVRGFPGATINVPVSLNFSSNDLRNVVAMQADVVFADDVLTTGTPASGTALRGHELASSQPVPGTKRLLVYSLVNSLFTNGVVASIPFSVAPGTVRNLTLTLQNVILSTTDGFQVFTTNVSGAIVINPVYRRPDGTADGFLSVSTNIPGDCYVVQATSDLQSWVNVSTNSASGDILFFLDTTAPGHPYRFYRAVVCNAVGSPMFELGALQHLASGGMKLEFPTEANRSYRIQASTNLQSWVDLQTVAGTGAAVTYTDSGATNLPYRFYRVRKLP